MRSLAIMNQKGGVGKTTTTVNLAAGLARAGKRVAILDMDPQAHASIHLGVDPQRPQTTMYDVLNSDAPLSEAWQQAGEQLRVAPAHIDLAAVEVELAGVVGREVILRDKLQACESELDYLLIDCPPSLSLLTVNAFAAAEEVLIPMQCEYYALEGLSDLVDTIKRVRAHLNPRLEIAGLLRTMFDPRNTLAHQVSQQLEQHFGDKVYRTLVPRNVRLAEAPSYGAPAVVWDAGSKGAQAYIALTEEILKGSR